MSEAYLEQLESFVRDIGIPPRPTILQHLAAENSKPEPDFNHMAELIARDVALAAALVKTANAPYFGLRQKVRTVREALMVLGLASASRTVAGLVLRQVFPPSPELERFWDASDRTAQLAAWLVRELSIRRGIQNEDAYTYALFRDCGIPVLLHRFPDYKAVLALANEDAERPFTATEEARLPTNHAIVGSFLAQSWWLPDATWSAIRHHHDLSEPASGYRTLSPDSHLLIALAQLAEYLLQSVTGMSATREWDKLGASCLVLLGLEEQDLPPLQTSAATFLKSLEVL